MKRSHSLIVVSTLALALAGAGSLVAQELSATPPTAVQLAEPQTPDANQPSVQPLAIQSFAGGALKASRGVTNDSPITTVSKLAYVALPGASVSYHVAPGQSELFTVTFGGECRLNNAGIDDWVDLQVRINGVPMSPSDNFSPSAFCGANSWSMHSATFLKRVIGAPIFGTTFVIQVYWKLRDSGVANPLSGWLDDTTLLLQVSE